MLDRFCKLILQKLLWRAEIKINGSNSWDIQVHDERFYCRVLFQGSLGLGEAYMDGWWDCKRLDSFFHHILLAGLDKWGFNPRAVSAWLKGFLPSLSIRKKSFLVGESHYDLGNDFFQAMLDKRLVYSCGYWSKGIDDLNLAQEKKLDLTCRKLKFHPGVSVLDIGCGFGSFLKYAVQKYGIRGVGITVSKEQLEFAKQSCRGLPIEIRLQDYHDLNESFDRIVSLGMFEHVEPKNYRTFMRVVNRCLRRDGLFLLHTIGRESADPFTDPWVRKYVFRVGMIPARKQIQKAALNIFNIRDWNEFESNYYDQTLIAWHGNFTRHWPDFCRAYAQRVGGRFERMWKYYLLSCAGAFRAKKLNVWQIVMSRCGDQVEYKPVWQDLA